MGPPGPNRGAFSSVFLMRFHTSAPLGGPPTDANPYNRTVLAGTSQRRGALARGRARWGLLAGLGWVAACGMDEGAAAPASPKTATLPALQPLDEVRVAAGEVVMVQGSKMVLNANDTIVSRVIRRDGIWEPLETTLFEREVGPGDVVIDVGANIGYYTLLAARLVGDEGHVYAFEPEPEAFGLLEHNVELNRYRNVTLVQKALGRETGRLELFLATKDRGDHRVYDPTGRRSSIDVDVITLDAYLAQQGIDRVDSSRSTRRGPSARSSTGPAARSPSTPSWPSSWSSPRTPWPSSATIPADA